MKAAILPCGDRGLPSQPRPSGQAAHLKMASVTTSEFVGTPSHTDAPPFSLIEQKGLLARLAEELARASTDLTRDPRGFIRDLFTNDVKDARRRRRIQIGLAFAIVAHIALVALIAFFGLRSLVKPKEEAHEVVEWVSISAPNAKTDGAKSDGAQGKDGFSGGGGIHTTTPASKGPLPQMAPAPQIVKPLAPTAIKPSLPMASIIPGPESAPPPVGVTLGIPTGVPSEAPSPGSGEGDGIGGGKGSGAGKGNGPGGEPGGGGKGTGPEGSGSSEVTTSTPSAIDWRRPPQTGYIPFAWIYKARAVVTPEAQENKVVGTVLLRATFHADGRITDIEIVNRVPYMTESAIEALSRSKFRPATINGVPVTLTKVLVKQEVHY